MPVPHCKGKERVKNRQEELTSIRTTLEKAND